MDHRRLRIAVVIFVIYVALLGAWWAYSSAEGKDVPEIRIPEDWGLLHRDFKKLSGRTFIALPEEATACRAKYGPSGLGWRFWVEFDLPSTKSPPEWLRHIADKSGAPGARVFYYTETRTVYLQDGASEQAPVDYKGPYEVLLADGRLTYNLFTADRYVYLWTND